MPMWYHRPVLKVCLNSSACTAAKDEPAATEAAPAGEDPSVRKCMHAEALGLATRPVKRSRTNMISIPRPCSSRSDSSRGDQTAGSSSLSSPLAVGEDADEDAAEAGGKNVSTYSHAQKV